MNDLEDQDPLLWANQNLEKEKQKLLGQVKDEAIEAIRCIISQLDCLHGGLLQLGRILPDQQTKFEKAQVGLSIAKSYLSEALNDIIINPQTIEVSRPDLLPNLN